MLRWMLTLLILFSAQLSLAESSVKKLCQEKMVLWGEQGHWLETSAFPESRNLEKFELYYWTYRPFDPALPSLLLFPGGPGQTFHEVRWFELPGYNLIYMDPRGMGCSQPPSPALSARSEFYSSRNVAFDAEVLRQHLKIKTWSVYGHSYGTVPATIYASLFGGHTTRVILEGTVFAGGQSLWAPEGREQLVWEVWRALPQGLKAKLQSLMDRQAANDLWFSSLLKNYLPLNGGLPRIVQQLDRFMAAPTEEALMKRLPVRADSEPQDLDPYFSARAHLMISCKELGALHFSVNRLYHFDGHSSRWLTKNDYEKNCRELALVEEPYSALDYPLQVPVIYLQGSWDYLTLASEARKHFQNQPPELRQFLELKNAGHNPLSSLLLTFGQAASAENKMGIGMMLQILSGHRFQTGDFQNFERSHQFWTVY